MMTYRDRQRLRAAQARRTVPAETKWPETIAELNSLPTSAASPAVTDSAAVRARLAQNAQQTLQALQSLQAERTRLVAQKAGDLRSRQQLMNAPYLSLTGRGALQISTSPAAQLSLFSSNQGNIPSPEPGPPPDYGQQTPEPSPTPQPNQTQGTVAYSKYGMIDPGVAIAQQIMEKRNKDLQEWGQTAATAPALGLPVPPVPPMPGVQASKPSGGQAGLSTGMIDPGLAEAERWNRTLHPEIYTEGDFVDLAPGDDVKDNPYGVDVNEFLRWAYSQLGYHEKASDADLDDKFANRGGNNYTKYGIWYDQYFNTTGFNGADWCAAFASWCAYKAGITDDQIYKRAGTQLFINWYDGKDRFEKFSTAPDAYIPRAGDLIFYQWNNKKNGHTGIVIGYKPAEGNEPAYVYTIEGNHDNKRGVWWRKVPLVKKSSISGFGANGGCSDGFIPPEFR
ncbi:MAG: CHAP domain-containing protein [Clostridiales bacterium]|nr:CHAP domain-containing protein [Clostridiales bacterium]